MSLAHILRGADARLRLDLVRPERPRFEADTAPAGRLAPPLAAAAVAYGLRLEWARRDPRSRGAWRAERAPERLATLAPDVVGAADDALARIRGESGRMEAVTPAGEAERALQLARLDAVVRAGYVDARIGQAEDAEDVAEVAAMLARVPWSELGAGVRTPPLFPDLVDALPDAEPDALVNGTLLAVSASRAPRVDDDEMRLLLARLIVARAVWGHEEAARRIRALGVLLARHGILWRAPVAPILAHEAFPTVEAWLLERLDEATAGEEPRGRSPMPKWVKKRFPPKAPLTDTRGKAEKKKRDAGEPRTPPPPKRPREGPPGDEAPRRKPKPDWRKNSPWRRERGL